MSVRKVKVSPITLILILRLMIVKNNYRTFHRNRVRQGRRRLIITITIEVPYYLKKGFTCLIDVTDICLNPNI